MSLSVVNLSQAAGQIDRPFALVTLGSVADLSVSLYLCQGEIEWHKHFDEDELFLVHEGVVKLETELGTVTLHPDECALVPKAIAHRSGSTLRSVVLLARAEVLSERRNGHRRLHATSADPRLEKARLSRPADDPDGREYEPIPIAMVEGFGLTLQHAKGIGPRLATPKGGALLLALRGVLLVDSADGGARLEAGEMTLLPGNTSYALSAPDSATVARLQAAD